MVKTKKGIISILMAMVMLVTFCVPAMAAETLKPTIIDGIHDGMITVSENQIAETRAGGWNPVYYSGQVYGYNASISTIALAGEATWSWGTVNPSYLSVIKEDYWWLANNGYMIWYFKYTWNSKDSTYLKIYDNNKKVYIESAVIPNTNYDIEFFVPGGTSTVDLQADWIVDGFRVNGSTIGGMKVIYN